MTTQMSAAINGNTFKIGDGFDALAFREKDFLGAMDPLVMVDHYKMTKPTFGAHPHAGLSAVSVLFEDSEGAFHNRDSLGNDFDLMPGDLYWLNAGAGVIHDESPRPGAHIHGLQVFVNLPATLKKSAPTALHVKSQSMPVYEHEGTRVRIVLGESNGLKGQRSPASPMTILDGKIAPQSTFPHQLNDRESVWVYVIQGQLQLNVQDEKTNLSSGQSIAISQLIDGPNSAIQLTNNSSKQSHFALFASQPINETFVQKGPFVMSSHEEIIQIEADFVSGKLGSLK
ncbi:MAG: pirin family protein [Aliiglaciecola sp.]